MNLFSHTEDENDKIIKKISLKNGELFFIENFINYNDSIKLYNHFANNINWKNDEVNLFGKHYILDRKSAMYSTINADYFYAGKNHITNEYTKAIFLIQEKINSLLPNLNFNSVLFNWYKNGSQKMGWHSDNEKELGDNPMIASLSLGAERRFDLKHNIIKNEKFQIYLPSGSLIIMGKGIQQNWKHQIPAQKKIMDGRINLTFRSL